MRRPTLAQAMVERTARADGCWEWLGNICTDTGYGRLGFGGVNLRAHRVSYELQKGPIPPGLVIDHLCRNRRCVNPDHLEAVTIRENTLRGEGITARRARAEKCQRGHPFDEANTKLQRGWRLCRTCCKARSVRFHAKQRSAA